MRRPVTDPRGLPPKANLDAELDLLAACLFKAETFDRVADRLRPEHFFAEAHRAIWEACAAVAATGATVETSTVRSYLADRGHLKAVGGAQWFDLLHLTRPAVAQPERVAAVIRNAWRQRELASRCQRIAAECYGDVGDLQAFIERSEAEIGALGHSDRADTSAGIRECIETTIKGILDGVTTGIATGLQAHDALTLGLHPGDVTIVAGRPGMGKTALALQLGMHVAQGSRDGRRNGVAVFSLEMERGPLTLRSLCSEARVNSKAVRAGTATPLDWRNLTDAATTIGKASLVIDDTPAITPGQLRSRCRQRRALWAREGIDLRVVVVDYLQLMDGRLGVGPRASREEQVAYCSRSLKALAKELGVAVVACAQIKRPASPGKVDRPHLSDLRESGGIEQDADVVVFIHRPEYYLGDKTPADDRGVAEVIVAKQRNGETGVRRCRWFDRYTLFTDIEGSDQYAQE